MGLSTVDFIIQEVATNLRRDRVITFATVAVVAVAVCVLGGVMLLFLNLGLWTERVADELKATVYLKSDVSRAQAMTLRSQLARWPNVSAAKLVTKEEGWEKFQRIYPITGRLERFPIPWTDAIEVHASSAEKVPGIVKRLAALRETKDLVPTPQEVGTQGSVPQQIIRLRHWVRSAAFVLSLVMALAGFLIIHNTIRLSLFARRREIAIMQAVGATPRFITAPFMIEGAVHGLVGATLACCILVPIHMYLRAQAANAGWAWIQLLPDNELLAVAAVLIFGGALLGAAGAWLSLRRYLSFHLEAH